MTDQQTFNARSQLLDTLRFQAGAVHDTRAEDFEFSEAQEVAFDAYYFARNTYAKSFGPHLEESDWSGYPSLAAGDGRTYRALAVAHLGDGIWVQYELRGLYPADMRGVLSLIAPCPCGTGYRDGCLEDEDDFLETFYAWVGGPATGPAPCDGDCRSVPCLSLAPLNEH